MPLSNRRRNVSGFTIAELLAGTVIVGFVITAVISFNVMTNQLWKEDLTMNDLIRNANIAIERMARGMSQNTGLQAAKSVSLPATGASADRVNYTDVNNASRSFYYSGGKILSEDGAAAASDVESVSFSNIDHMIQIALVLSKNVVNKAVRFSTTTRVTPRN